MSSGMDAAYSLGSFGTTNLDSYRFKEPANFFEALEQFNRFCQRQLPKNYDTVFKPVCFDVSEDERYVVVGGQYGNVANIDTSLGKILRDEEICNGFPITNILLVLKTQQVVVTNSNFEIFFLEFPALKPIYKSYFPDGINYIKSDIRTNRIYFCNSQPYVGVIQLSQEEDFYTENYVVTKISHDSNVENLEISDDGGLMAIAGDQGAISIVDLTTENIIKEIGIQGSKVVILAFSDDSDCVAAAFENNKIKIWGIEMEMSLKYIYCGHDDRITGLAFVRGNKYLVSSSIDKIIKVWDTKVESMPYVLNMNDSEVLSLKPSQSHLTVYYIQNTTSLMSWKIPLLFPNARYRAHTSKIIKLLFVPQSNELISIGKDGLIIIWDYKLHIELERIEIKGPLTDAILTSDSKNLIISSEDMNLYTWEMPMNKVEVNELGFIPVSIALSEAETLIAVSDTFSRVIINDYDVLVRRKYLKGHLEIVTCMHFINNDKHLVTASRDCTLSKWDVETGARIVIMSRHETAVLKIVMSDAGYIISGSEDGMVIIWTIEGVLLYILVPTEPEPNTGIYISEDHSFLITLQNHRVSYWQLENLSLLFQTDTLYKGLSLAVSSNEFYVAIAEWDTIYIEENCINTTRIRIIGKNHGSMHRFMQFVLDSQKETVKAQYSMEYNHWLVLPYLIGPAHLLAYSNRHDDLNKAFFSPQNKASFISSIKGENPLSICVEMQYKNCIDICIKFMKIESQDRINKPKNPRAFVPLESCLAKLNTIDYPYITKLYDSMMVENNDMYLPRFCMIEADLPALHLSDQYTIIPDKIVKKEYYTNTGRPIVFSQSTFPLDIDLGTYGSIYFLKSLLDCSNPEIFRSAIVQEYLQCKWRKIKPAQYTLGFIYISYLILLGLHIVVLLESKAFLLLLIIVHVVLVLYEVLQVATDFGDYWRSTWNVLDQMRSISFSFYAIMAWKGNYNTDILLAVLIFSWTRGISCFRMFDETRYMVRLIIQVIVDITTFFFILFYATLAFAFVYYMRKPEAQPFPMYLTVAYRLDLGDFDTNITDPFDWIIFFIATMINPLIMLNLLIAIMSDTATAVDLIDDICGLRELTEMIVDLEKVMFWKKHLTHKHYLHKCDFVQVGESGADKTMEKIKTIKKQVITVQNSIKKITLASEKIIKADIETKLSNIVKDQIEIEMAIKDKVGRNNKLVQEVEKKLKKG
ncbi:hypothetical protein SteCoe_21330 [Stentor coeruleus]|uniref:Uncharacterized protein n=1 Tax=Stentor coeruleus TaxID=5963 RepID=A0A1R2BPT0_9CILI|nr:hypothetical protein SteCoe_21330 [Stentor coeruleus]